MLFTPNNEFGLLSPPIVVIMLLFCFGFISSHRLANWNCGDAPHRFGSNSFEKDNNFVRSVERFSNTYKRQFHQLLLFFYKTTVVFSTFLFFLDNLSTSSHSCHYLDCLNSYHEVECIPALLRCAEAILHGYSSSCFLSFCLLRCHHNHLLYHQYSFSTGYP